MDYNINHYTKEELESMLNLEPDYNPSSIKLKYAVLENLIQNKDNITPNIKHKIISFLKEAKAQLEKESGFPEKPHKIEVRTPHDVIKRELQPYINSFPDNTQMGVLNPLERRTFMKIVNIDTKFRDNYDTSSSCDFSFDLPVRFSNVVSMDLSSVEFPSRYYLTSLPGNNYYYFTLEIEYVIKYVCIPSEIHNFSDLIDYLNSYFKLLGTTEPIFANITFSFTVTNPVIQAGIVTISNGVGGAPFSINFSSLPQDNRPLSSNLGWLLGFRHAIYQDSNSYTSETLANDVSDRYLFLVVDEFCNNKSDIFYSCFTTSLLNKNILGRIILRQDNTIQLVFEPRQYFGPIDITKLHIQLLDEYGNVVKFQNIDYSFCLRLNTIYNI